MVTGETQDYIGLDESIRLYVNHRPVIPLERHLIQAAFNTISERYEVDVILNRQITISSIS